MKIAVCIKAVPNSEQYDRIRLDPVKKTIVREGVESVINAADLHAIELAMQLKQSHGGTVSLISMGPPSAEQKLREGLSYGCDEAWLISDRKFGGADALATSYTLAKAIEKIGAFDLILLGNVSEDGATAHVPSQLGELLGLPHLTDVTAFSLENETTVHVSKPIGSGTAEYAVTLPAVFGVDRRLNQVRHPNVMGIFSAKNKPLTVLTAADIPGLDENRLGLSGSPTKAGEYRSTAYDRTCVALENAGALLRALQKARR